jgi:hypothetical protein
MADTQNRQAALLLAATLAWTLALALLGASNVLLFCAPALLLALPLAFNRYVGEDTLAALATRRPCRRRPAPALVPGSRFAPYFTVRGGRLIAASLAKRPPPHAVALT